MQKDEVEEQNVGIPLPLQLKGRVCSMLKVMLGGDLNSGLNLDAKIQTVRGRVRVRVRVEFCSFGLGLGLRLGLRLITDWLITDQPRVP